MLLAFCLAGTVSCEVGIFGQGIPSSGWCIQHRVPIFIPELVRSYSGIRPENGGVLRKARLQGHLRCSRRLAIRLIRTCSGAVQRLPPAVLNNVCLAWVGFKDMTFARDLSELLCSPACSLVRALDGSAER